MSNGIYRVMNEKERAYFGKPLADVVLAMDKVAQEKHQGHCVAELSSGDAADMSKPAAWLRDQGKLTPAGLAPSSWEVPVACPGLHAVITLSPVTLTVVPEPGDKPTGVGADVFTTAGHLVIGDFIIATTRTPKAEERPKGPLADAWADMPALAKPVAIQIRAEQAPGDLVDYIDLDSARAALANMKAPPPRSNPAVESEEQRADEGTLRRAEESVIAYLAGRNGPKKTVVIADTSWRGGLPSEAEAVLPGIAPEILASAIVDYREKNRESKPISKNLNVPGTTVALVSEEALRSYFQEGSMAQGWQKFSAAYGDTQLLTFSRVGLSHDLSQAVVFQGYQGPRIGVGSLLFLRREADTWRLMYQLRLWVESTETNYRVERPTARRTPKSDAAKPLATAGGTPAKPEPEDEEPAATKPTTATKPTVATAPTKPTDATPAAAAPEPPPKVGLAHVKVRFVNDVDMFRFDRAEFFVNGDMAGKPLKKIASGDSPQDVWEGSVPAGASVLRVRLSYLGKGFFPFLYLDSYPFVRETIKNVSVKRDGHITLTVTASQSPGATKTMEDTLVLNVNEE
jgi:hypothetical protein